MDCVFLSCFYFLGGIPWQARNEGTKEGSLLPFVRFDVGGRIGLGWIGLDGLHSTDAQHTYLLLGLLCVGYKSIFPTHLSVPSFPVLL